MKIAIIGTRISGGQRHDLQTDPQGKGLRPGGLRLDADRGTQADEEK